MPAQYFSKEGLEKLKQELEYRETVLRPAIATRIRDAKEQGDLAENAEFDSAKEDQSMNEGRVNEIKAILEDAIIISSGSNGSGVVGVGSTVRAESPHGKQTFVIVGASESNPIDGFISNESPLGKAFLGHKKGDSVSVVAPRGTTEYSITEVK